MSRRLGTASLLAASLLAASLLAAVGLGAAVSIAEAQDFDGAGEQAMLERINALRAEQQLAAVVRLPTLDAVARAHSAEMARNGALAHVSTETGSPEDRVRNAGVDASGLSENVALHSDAALAHEALLQSPPHRANMLAPGVTHVGLGVVRTEGGAYVTQVFAQISPAAPLAEVVDADDADDAPADVAAPTPEPIFGLIPPFMERVAEQVIGPAAQTIEAPVEAPLDAQEIAPETSAAPNDLASVDAPTSADAPTTAPAVSAPATQNTLRQLVDLAQALLRGPSPVQAQ